MSLRHVFADVRCAVLCAPEPGDDGRTEQEAENQRRDDGATCPECDVPEKVESLERVGQRGQKIVQHARQPLPAAAAPGAAQSSSASSASAIGIIRLP